MQVTITPIVIGAFGTVTKGLLKVLGDLKFGGRIETIQTTTLLRTGKNPEKSPGDLKRLAYYLNSCERPSANVDVKNSKGVNTISICRIKKKH